MHLLWWWALDYAQSGDLSEYTDEDIADAACWDEDPKIFINALVEAGFLDEDDGRKFIHDWRDYAGKLLEKRQIDRERKRKPTVIPSELQRNSNGESTDSIRTVPNPTVQNHYPPTPRKRGKRAQVDSPSKTQYAEFVSMTDDEHKSLVAKLGVDGTVRCIEILDNYKGSNGKKYDSDYRAILNWVVNRYEEEQRYQQTGKGKPDTLDVLAAIIAEEGGIPDD